MIKLLTVSAFFTTFLSIGCRHEYQRLEKYYDANIILHSRLHDSLTAFCQANHTEVILRNLDHERSKTALLILNKSTNTYYSVEFDSGLRRTDPDNSVMSKFHIPLSVIKDFNKSRYNAISSDSLSTFFASNWRTKIQLGTQGEIQYGILFTADTGDKKNCKKKLSARACIATGLIP